METKEITEKRKKRLAPFKRDQERIPIKAPPTYVCTRSLSQIPSNVSHVHLHGNKYVSDSDLYEPLNAIYISTMKG